MVNFLRVASSLFALSSVAIAAPVPANVEVRAVECPSFASLNTTVSVLTKDISVAVKDLSLLVNEAATHKLNSSSTVLTTALVTALEGSLSELNTLNSTITAFTPTCVTDDLVALLLPQLGPFLGLVDILANLLLDSSLSEADSKVGPVITKVVNLVDEILTSVLGTITFIQKITSIVVPEITTAESIIEALTSQLEALKSKH